MASTKTPSTRTRASATPRSGTARPSTAQRRVTTARDSHGRFTADHRARNVAIGTASVLGAVAAGVAAALRFGLLDRLLPGAFGSGAEHEAPDLALDQRHPEPGSRVPDAFRPDPTAAVPASEREGLRPAPTVANGFSEDRRVEEVAH